MKLHGNARTCPKSRRLLVERLEGEWSLTEAAEAAGVSERTAAKWLARWRAEGEVGLLDRSSAPKARPTQLPADRVGAIEALRRLRMTAAEIAEVLGMALSTVSRWLKRIGLGKRSRLSRQSRPIATSASAPASCSTSTSRSWCGSERGAGHRLTGKRTWQASGALAGSSSTSASTMPPGSPTSRSCPTRRDRPQPASCAAQSGGLPSMGIAVERVMSDNGACYRSTVHARGLQGARPPAPLYPALPSADQRQGGALHPDADQPLGLRGDLRQLCGAHRRPTWLAHPLQLHKTTRLPRPQGARELGSPS